MRIRYFVVLDHDVEGTHHNPKWDKDRAIQWAKEMAKQGHNAKIYEGKFIKGFDAKITVIDDDEDLK